ncbi:hypothetical protein E2C01_060610 [Portunus trituberculatus]|uniref:Uncharacterized protein n=1 Tax=Portunus trituberculatus TaxID=210409 RepID=A0A5B7H2Y5_PORTR|nr:hypothetical protein [Portunus trituberculatus]
MVPASATAPTTTTGGFHASVPRTDKAVHSALGTFCTVCGDGVGNSHLAPMPVGYPITQDTEVGVCRTAPMPDSQTPIQDMASAIWLPCLVASLLSPPMVLSAVQDVKVGVCHMAPMLGSQLIIPSHGLGVGETFPLLRWWSLATAMLLNVWWPSPYPEYEC